MGETKVQKMDDECLRALRNGCVDFKLELVSVVCGDKTYAFKPKNNAPNNPRK